MREVVLVGSAVFLTEVSFWWIGPLGISTLENNWPWLLQRHAVLFPVLFLPLLLLLRKSERIRSSLRLTILLGALAGLASSTGALLAASLFTSAERELLLSGVDLAGPIQVVLSQAWLASILTLGWLHGGVAALVALLGERSLGSTNGEPAQG